MNPIRIDVYQLGVTLVCQHAKDGMRLVGSTTVDVGHGPEYVRLCRGCDKLTHKPGAVVFRDRRVIRAAPARPEDNALTRYLEGAR